MKIVTTVETQFSDYIPHIIRNKCELHHLHESRPGWHGYWTSMFSVRYVLTDSLFSVRYALRPKKFCCTDKETADDRDHEVAREYIMVYCHG